MGLDSVELVMEIEEHFGISITDEEGPSLVTVSDMVDLVRRRILAAETTVCFSLPCFLALRRTTRDIMADETLRLRPSTRIVDTLSPANRRELWRRVPILMGASNPQLLWSLRRPYPMRIGLLSVSVLVCLIPSLYDVAYLPVSLVVDVGLWICLLLVTRQFRTEPSIGLETFGGLTRLMTSRHIATEPAESADPDALLAEIRPIITTNFGCKESDVVPSARFIEDLGFG